MFKTGVGSWRSFLPPLYLWPPQNPKKSTAVQIFCIFRRIYAIYINFKTIKINYIYRNFFLFKIWPQKRDCLHMKYAINMITKGNEMGWRICYFSRQIARSFFYVEQDGHLQKKTPFAEILAFYIALRLVGCFFYVRQSWINID